MSEHVLNVEEKESSSILCLFALCFVSHMLFVLFPFSRILSYVSETSVSFQMIKPVEEDAISKLSKLYGSQFQPSHLRNV